MQQMHFKKLHVLLPLVLLYALIVRCTLIAVDNYGNIKHPVDGSFTLTYGEAVDEGYCRPVTFSKEEGKLDAKLKVKQLLKFQVEV